MSASNELQRPIFSAMLGRMDVLKDRMLVVSEMISNKIEIISDLSDENDGPILPRESVPEKNTFVSAFSSQMNILEDCVRSLEISAAKLDRLVGIH